MAYEEKTASKKRRRQTTTPVPRKRTKDAPTSVTEPRPLHRRLCRQSTLTQIDFVRTTLDLVSDDDVTGVSGPDTPSARSRRSTRRSVLPKLAQQDSTLTQMGYFGVAHTDGSADVVEYVGESPRRRSVSKQSVATASQGCKEHVNSSHERSEMAPPRRESMSSTRQSRSMRPQVESQEYQSPQSQSRKRRRIEIESPQTRANPRRTSRLEGSKPPLIIADSTDFTEMSVDSVLPGLLPITPVKIRDEIASSQSPESIRHSARKDRQPLAELPENVLFLPQKPTKNTELKPKITRGSKMSVLKAPEKTVLPRVNRLEGGAHDIWSIKATSSPKRDSSGTRTTARISNEAATSDTESIASVHAVAPAHLLFDPYNSSSDVNEVFRESWSREARKSLQKEVGTVVTASVVVSTQPHLRSRPTDVIPELDDGEEGEESQFGSPVANDTQFVRSMDQRISSPTPISSSGYISMAKPTTESRLTQHHSPLQRALLRRDGSPSPVLPPSLPPPRLVPSPRKDFHRQSSTSTISTLVSVPTPQLSSSPKRARERAMIFRMPLNDTAEYQKSSSSPALPPSVLSVHGSTFPASIPHPSQVSTQAPSTQGFFPATPVEISCKPTDHSILEQIVIKDSSSVPSRLSQFNQSFEPTELSEEDFVDSDDDDLNRATLYESIITNDDQPRRKDDLADDTGQSLTPKSRCRAISKREPTTQSSPILVGASTRSQRDARLEIIDLPSSSQPPEDIDDDITPKPFKTAKSPSIQRQKRNLQPSRDEIQPRIDHNRRGQQAEHDAIASSPSSSSVYSPSPPRPLRRKYTPIPDFDNDTQSDFTQNGHVTAAFIHRAREDGWMPQGYVPRPYQLQSRKSAAKVGQKST